MLTQKQVHEINIWIKMNPDDCMEYDAELIADRFQISREDAEDAYDCIQKGGCLQEDDRNQDKEVEEIFELIVEEIEDSDYDEDVIELRTTYTVEHLRYGLLLDQDHAETLYNKLRDERNVIEILRDILDNDLLDDRREYDLTDLKDSYDFTNEQARSLFNKIQRACGLDPEEVLKDTPRP